MGKTGKKKRPDASGNAALQKERERVLATDRAARPRVDGDRSLPSDEEPPLAAFNAAQSIAMLWAIQNAGPGNTAEVLSYDTSGAVIIRCAGNRWRLPMSGGKRMI